jgi:hypothetical protein
MGGKLSNKAQEIADAKSGDTKIEVGRSEDVKVRLYGNTAIVNGRWIEKSNTKGKLFDGTHLYTTVYVKGWEMADCFRPGHAGYAIDLHHAEVA